MIPSELIDRVTSLYPSLEVVHQYKPHVSAPIFNYAQAHGEITLKFTFPNYGADVPGISGDSDVARMVGNIFIGANRRGIKDYTATVNEVVSVPVSIFNP